MSASQTLKKVGLYESEEEAVLREEVLGCLDAVRIEFWQLGRPGRIVTGP